MTKKNSMPSFKALPLTALVVYLIMLVVFEADSNEVHATVVNGLLVAWTPVLIIAGAIFLFKTMEVTGGLAVIRKWLNTISNNQVAQLMIVGWAFPFLIEGASGFGTPAAIAAPVLVGLGFPPVRVAILTLVMNSVPVSFGAVGTPTWFGFSQIQLSDIEIMQIGIKSSILNASAALVITSLALMFIVKPKAIIQNIVFILLSVLITVIPYVIVARFNYEFPALVGGAVGLIGTAILAKSGFGLSKQKIELQESVGKSNLVKTDTDDAKDIVLNAKTLLKASFPLWGTLLLLVITRIPQLGIKPLLTAVQPALNLNLGSIGEFSLSASGVIGLSGIFNTSTDWSHSLLFVPSLLPFGLISILAYWWNKSPRKEIGGVLNETMVQMRNPLYALLGALVFVNLMMMGGDQSAVNLIGNNLASVTGNTWQFFSSFLGAVGSFFSGSNTISNLTFAGIQDSIASNLGLDRTTILAMQSVGGAMGNMVC
ncbi:MAG: L-lactate permease, partial [Bacteroidales bacterium]|nr:L-lactate permease [Bacteroidales bacterium]